MARRRRTALGLVLVAILTAWSSPAAEGASYRTRDLDLADLCAEALPWTAHAPLPLPPRPPRDEEGVPMVIVDGERYYRPGALAINGMKRLDAYQDTGERGQLDQALIQAEGLRELSISRKEADWLPFRYDYPAAGQEAPWFNAMVQGLALSFYVRLWRVTGDPVHLEAARRVFMSFLRTDTDRKPWVAYVDEPGFLWLEHYPGRGPRHVLNAHLHALFGIHEYWQATRSAKARQVLEGAITTMRENADRYRRPGGPSLYDLTHRTRIIKYHEIHVWQLRLLALISGDPWFAELARGFVADLQPRGQVPGRPPKLGKAYAGPQCRATMP